MNKKTKKFSEMSEKELRDVVIESRSAMVDLLETAEAEERDPTDEERAQFEEMKKRAELAEDWQIANQRALALVTGPEPKPEERKVHDVFAENLRRSAELNQEIKIEVRETITSVDVKDTIPVLFQDVIRAAEPALIIEKIGAKMLWNVQGQPTWPTLGSVKANWEGENTQLSATTVDFGAIRANPNRLGIEIDVSKRALNMSNQRLYEEVVGLIGRAIAAAVNQALVSFTKVATNAPSGVFIRPATNAVPMSKSPSLKEIVDLETAVMNSNIESDADGFGAYIIGTAMRGKLKSTPIEKGNPRMILEGTTLNGYPVIVTNYMPQNAIGFGFFEYAAISQFGALDFTYDPKAKANQYKVVFIANAEFDITNLKEEAFAVGLVATAPTIFADNLELELETAANKAVTAEVVVKGINLGADIAVSKSGTNASLVTIDSTKFEKDEDGRVNGTLTITYTPTAAGEHSATVTLKSTGATDVEISIAGVAE